MTRKEEIRFDRAEVDRTFRAVISSNTAWHSSDFSRPFVVQMDATFAANCSQGKAFSSTAQWALQSLCYLFREHFSLKMDDWLCTGQERYEAPQRPSFGGIRPGRDLAISHCV